MSSISSPQHNNPLSLSLTHALQKQQGWRSQSSSSNRRPFSNLTTPKTEPISDRQSKSSQGVMYTPQHVHYQVKELKLTMHKSKNSMLSLFQNPYSNTSGGSSNWSTTSLYVTPISSNSSPSSGYGSSVYTTPIGGSPCRSRFSDSPSLTNSPLRYHGYPQNHQMERLQLHIEGQSSLV